jgi:hypothetical protein
MGMVVDYIFPLVIVVIVCYVSYENALSNDFVFDDHLAIVNNKDTSPAEPFSQILQDDIWGKDMRAIDSHRSYRPLLIMIFRLLRSTADGGLDPYSFRLVSILAHMLVSCQSYSLTLNITKSKAVAFAASLLFASHPVHVESVSAVVNMAEALSCICYMTAYSVFISASHKLNIGAQVPPPSPSASEGTSTDDSLPADSMPAPVSSDQNNSNYKLSFTAICLRSFLWLFIVFIGILFKETALTVCGIVWAEMCLSFRIQYFNSKGALSSFIWTSNTIAVFALYSLLRYSIIHRPSMDDIFAADWKNLGFGSSYLNDSPLIRRAENPFAFLEGSEWILSTMVSFTQRSA